MPGNDSLEDSRPAPEDGSVSASPDEDAVPPLPSMPQPDGSQSASPPGSPVSARPSADSSVGSSSDFERSAAPMVSSGLGDAGTSTLPITRSLSYRCRL